MNEPSLSNAAGRNADYDEVRVDSVEHIDELNHQHGWSVQVQQLKPGALRGGIDLRSFEHGMLARETYNTSLSILNESPREKVVVMVGMSKGPQLRVNGLELSETSALIIWPGAETNIFFTESAAVYMAHFDSADFIENLEHLYPSLSSRLPNSGAGLYDCRRDQIESLRTCMRHELYGTRSADSAEEEEFSILESLSMNALATALHYLDPDEYKVGSRRHIAMKTREYIDTNYHQTVSLPELCRCFRTSARTIERAFMETFSVTVRHYVKVRRLNAARTALVSSDSKSISVTDAAMAAGFTHLGRFSVEYKKLFNESPSESL